MSSPNYGSELVGVSHVPLPPAHRIMDDMSQVQRICPSVMTQETVRPTGR